MRGACAARIISGLAILTVACMPYSPVEAPRSPVPVPDLYASGGEAPPTDAAEVSTTRWWLAFGDPQLTALEERALGHNLGLAAAFARVEQARALADQAGAPLWPTLGIEASVGRQRQRFGSFPAQQYNSFALSAPVSYEIDLFDRYGGEAAAAGMDALSAHDDAEALAMTLSAEVAEAWYDLVHTRAQRALLERQLETNGIFLELAQLRFQQGLASALDVFQQQQQVVATRARLTLVDAQQTVVRNRLSALVAQPPGAVAGDGPEAMPELPELPALGVPADLVHRRPDVRAARRRVVAADYRVGAAIADRFPSIRLRGSVGFGATTIADLFQDLIWSVVGTIAQPILDGGRRGAEIDRRHAIVDERLDQYGQALLGAMVEVDNALVQERQQRLHITELEQQVAIAESTLREARNRYREGSSDFLPVLTSIVSLQSAELSLLTARRQLVSYRIQLCRALGGAWTGELSGPSQPETEDDGEPR